MNPWKPWQPSTPESLVSLPLRPPALLAVSSARAHTRGFSLLEAIVAMAILGFITMLSWMTFDGVARMKETVDATSDSFASARVALNRISRELSMLYMTRSPSCAGGIPRWMTTLRAEPGDPIDALHFAAMSHQRLYRESLEADSTELSYFGEADDESPGLYVLLHREGTRIDGKPEEGGVVEVLARRVSLFQLRFYDQEKQEWIEEWDIFKNNTQSFAKIPRAIEVSLTVVDLEGIEHPYTTTVLLANATKMQEGLECFSQLSAEQ
ncbi:MAG: type II secretion system protein GspJ [Myxococcota bacterium]